MSNTYYLINELTRMIALNKYYGRAWLVGTLVYNGQVLKTEGGID